MNRLPLSQNSVILLSCFQGKMAAVALVELLQSLKLKGIIMTGRSLRLLSLTVTEQEGFARAQKDSPLSRQVFV